MDDPDLHGLGPDYRLTVEDAPAEADVEILPYALEAYNEGRWPQHPPWRPLAVFLRTDARIAAGLAGETYCGWLFVKYLWVSKELRGRGVGRELMMRGERCARERGCHSAWLDTFSFQAQGFYEKLGYREFGRLDYPPGHSRHFLQKQLV
ncbi:MAG TPA: GNAT family N-acetyltransferase [Stellaceae bacterium]|nr:GNAT family N-acetyltransferase [Stellaceae bacterium]